MKYNENFSRVYIPFLLTDLQVRPVGGFSRTMKFVICDLFCDKIFIYGVILDDVASCKGQTFLGKKFKVNI